MLSVSIVICCHNSSQRLPGVLDHLACQEVPPGLSWEIVVIDNLSMDSTQQTAEEYWRRLRSLVPIRVVREDRLGAGFARFRGLSEAEKDIVSFVDDDNWVSPDWICRVSEIMQSHPEIGACGGRNEPVCGVEPPFWFQRFSGHYAVGAQFDKPGDVTQAGGFLYGAGLSVRRSAWLEILKSLERDHPWCHGRRGNQAA
ncbi:MAG: glycosyltransferase family 2 protein, partial [Candidatus Omnitrophica bacterium]|nr:glycosyltransferase family 2 protein [Candidatus Omnitrophota bacterium]